MRTKKTPIAMISPPAMWSSVSWGRCSVEPMPVAVIPSATNMTVNDRQKMIAGPRTRESVCSPERRSATRDAGDGREVARHERQHAGRDERDEADRERGEDGGVGLGGGERRASRSRRRSGRGPRPAARASAALSSGTSRRRRPAAGRGRARRRQRGSSDGASATSAEHHEDAGRARRRG